MENTFVVNDEPMTIRITIEIIPPKKADVAEPVVKQEENIVEAPIVHSEYEPMTTPSVVDLIVPPKKERKKRTPKAPVTEVITPPVEEEKPVEDIVSAPVTPVVSTPTTKPTGTARIVKLVTFFCKGQNINPSDITIDLLKEKAFDIIEGYEDSVVQTAIDEFKKANVK
jgi:hypothetical protein